MNHFYPFLAYVLVTTFTPGPNNILAMTNGLRYGYLKTLRFLAGQTLGFFLVMLLIGLMNVALVSVLPQIKPVLNWLGAGYMLYLAVHILRSKPTAEDEPAQAGSNTFRAGLLMQFLNLKVILYGISIFSLFIIPFSQNLLVVSLFAPFLAGVGFLAVSSWAISGDLFRSLVRQHTLAFNLVMAALLVYTAVTSLLG